MEFANTLIKLFAASQVMLCIGILIIAKNPPHVRAIGITLMAAVMAYFLVPFILLQTDMNNPLVFFLVLFQARIPVLTLLFIWAVFEEDCRFPTWLIGLVLIDICVGITTKYLVLQGALSNQMHAAAQLLKVFAATFAIYIVWRGREYDLVEKRSSIRLALVAALAVTVLGVTITKIFEIYNISLPGTTLGSLWLLAVIFFCNLSFIKMNPSLSLVGDPNEPVGVNRNSDPIIDDLLQRMRDERLYANHDLRVGGLADVIGLPEYQLRRKINKNLGYRNFNQFVNRYRIEEAGQRLIEDNRMPVLSIALDVGFRSISSFNSAFHTQFGVSPTTYRRQAELKP